MADYFGDLLAGAPPAGGDPLHRAYGGLAKGDNLYSQKRNFVLSFQTDGNLVLYAIDSSEVPLDTTNLTKANANYPKVIWQAPTSFEGQGPIPANECDMQGDGNFVLYGLVYVETGGINQQTGNPNTARERKPLWASGTNGHDGAWLRCQNDGNLVVYWLNQSNNLVYAPWNSNTFAGIR